ncbi:MAG: hypothetical protein KDK91_33540 [Gammaproteobacteria bacterium]|nr:hypothetical protein [Gammaproteobacteria bacterium]
MTALIADLFDRADARASKEAWYSLRAQLPPASARCGPAFLSLAELRSAGVADTPEATTVPRYAAANALLHDGLSILQNRDSLTRPLPAVVADVALFCLHRHGFSGERSAPLIQRAIETRYAGRGEAG